MEPNYVVALQLKTGRVIRRGFDDIESGREFLHESSKEPKYVSGVLFDATDNTLDDFGPDVDE